MLLAQVLTGISNKLQLGPSPRLVCRATFEGAEHESPTAFLQDLQTYFMRSGITDTKEEAQLTIERLKGQPQDGPIL